MWDLIVSVPDHCLSFYFWSCVLVCFWWLNRPFFTQKGLLQIEQASHLRYESDDGPLALALRFWLRNHPLPTPL